MSMVDLRWLIPLERKEIVMKSGLLNFLGLTLWANLYTSHKSFDNIQ